MDWVPVATLPPCVNHDASDLVLVCVKVKHLRRPKMRMAYYCFRREGWRTVMGPVDDGTVTHWCMPTLPDDYE